MKVAIIGSNGQLGSDLVNEFSQLGSDVIPLTHSDIRVENIDSVRSILKDINPNIIMNTAAYHIVPKCEESPVKSYQINSLGALNVAKCSEELDAVNLYFSTDYVFDGAKLSPYLEIDRPNPLNIYASTKLLGEYHTLNYHNKSIVIRISGIYGKVPCRAKGGNFITTMIKVAKEKPEVKVVNDEILTPTPTSEIAKRTYDIIKSDSFGLFHLTCEGQCSWYEFAKIIFESLNLKTPLTSCSVKDNVMAVKRPTYSVLENRNAKQLGIRIMPHWNDALIKFLSEHYN